jgi:hypothetical protein
MTLNDFGYHDILGFGTAWAVDRVARVGWRDMAMREKGMSVRQYLNVRDLGQSRGGCSRSVPLYVVEVCVPSP